MNNMNIIVQCSVFIVLFDLISTNQDVVTYSSTFKLLNQQSGDRLHSHDVKYGSGSGQQSVTGTPNADDVNSYWQVSGENYDRGTPIKCDSMIQLLHVATRKNLHSHDFSSPLSHNQEVSAYGENGLSDEGDQWKVICTSRNDYWMRKDWIRLQHVATGKYLHLTGDTYGRPIHGQKEICCYPRANNQNIWKVEAGVYVRPSSEPLSSIRDDQFNINSQSIHTDHVDYEL
ncbi:unnamed protein product [Rotaria sp. Silwood2]|nr:unnamed protein product [Rotaria sp. Silwood2]CAF2687966.1 unnamed protein product [Rotaria sp. Silwood2]CAF2932718.1 unnamed protein product [Rotaria sp. Silwood2]CAF3097394.1 unnamed protein product [Rotaria sp. Silwood2]CAF4114240.1 unnamed protein product [Rotaria sp. Silwood2]